MLDSEYEAEGLRTRAAKVCVFVGRDGAREGEGEANAGEEGRDA